MGNKSGEDRGFLTFMKKNKKSVSIATVTVLTVAIAGGVYVANIKNNLNDWNYKIYPGVTVKGVDLSGKSAEEAKNILNDNLNDKISNKDIVIKVDDKEFKGKYKDIDGKYNVDKAVEDAVKYGKDKSMFKQNKIIKGKENKELEIEFLYNDKKLGKLKENVQKNLNIEPKNATINIVGSSKNITEETLGKKLEVEELNNSLKENLNGDLENPTIINLNYVESKPKVTKEELSKIKDVMGSFESSFATSTPERSANIQAAVGFVDGTVLMPGEEFSYDKATSTDKSKYKQAPVYINNKVEMDIGGGICQVSSALYRAMMRANIRPTERHNHSLTVSYAKPSLDATVAWGYLDYKFKNPYDFPIYIKGTSDGKVIRFYVYGDKSALNGKTYDMENEIIRTIAPKEKIEKDSNLEEGKRVVQSKGQAGYVSKGYQLTYENGKLIKRELVSTDTYATTDSVVKVGTKKPEIKVDKPKEEVPANKEEQQQQQEGSEAPPVETTT